MGVWWDEREQAYGKLNLWVPNKEYKGVLIGDAESERSIHAKKPLIGPQKESDRGKKTLILDLDHTLVVGSRTNRGDHDFIVEGNYHMYRRPGLEEFLRAAADHFEIVVYTAASSNYAAEVLEAIDEEKVVKWRISRRACRRGACRTEYIKDLQQLGRLLSACIMIDDLPENVLPRENVLSIKKFSRGSTGDTELADILPILRSLEAQDDVRELLGRYDEERCTARIGELLL